MAHVSLHMQCKGEVKTNLLLTASKIYLVEGTRFSPSPPSTPSFLGLSSTAPMMKHIPSRPTIGLVT